MIKDYKKSTKRIIGTLLLLAIALGIAYIFIVGRIFSRVAIGIYMGRYRESNPQEMLLTLEKVFSIKFPNSIKNVRTAKTPVHDGIINFIVKFEDEPNNVDKFLESFPEKIDFLPYGSKGRDDKKNSIWPSPRWFKVPIRKGQKNCFGLGGRDRNLQSIYINTTNEKKFLLYIQGLYESNLEN